MRSALTSVFCISLIIPCLTIAQDDEPEFRLFEDVEQSSSNSSRSAQRRATRNGGEPDVPEPEFTLQGTSRIGDDYKAILLNKSGSTVIVEVEPGSSTGVEGYRGYAVVDIGGGRVSLQLPDDTPCIESSGRGVECSSTSNIALLSLAIGEPLAARVRAEEVNPAPDESSTAPEENTQPAADGTDRTNPFEAISRQNAGQTAAASALGNTPGNVTGAAAAGTAATPARQFTPRRISPEEVPAGMRVVSTPFGDRLVEQ